MIAPGLSIDTVRIPPLVVEVRHLVWKHKNHLQKLCRDFSQGIFKGMLKIFASKECECFQNVGQYKDHMLLTLGYWFLYVLHYLQLFRRALNHMLSRCTRTTALTQEFSACLKHSVSLPQMGPKWPTQQIQEVTDCTLWNLLLSSAFCVPRKHPAKSPAGRMVWEECMWEEQSGLIGLCLFNFYTASQAYMHIK